MKVDDADQPRLEVLRNSWTTANDGAFTEASRALTYALGLESDHQAKLVVFHLTPERIKHIGQVLRGDTGVPLLGLDSETPDRAKAARWIEAALTRVHDAATKELS